MPRVEERPIMPVDSGGGGGGYYNKLYRFDKYLRIYSTYSRVIKLIINKEIYNQRVVAKVKNK